jgi:hypothetical protein
MNLKRNQIYTENTIKIEICAVNPTLNPKPFISHQNRHLVHAIMKTQVLNWFLIATHFISLGAPCGCALTSDGKWWKNMSWIFVEFKYHNLGMKRLNKIACNLKGRHMHKDIYTWPKSTLYLACWIWESNGQNFNYYACW